MSKSAMACMARLDPSTRFEPIPAAQLAERLELNCRWRDLSILSLPTAARQLFRGELGVARRRALERGDAIGVSQFAIPKRKLRVMHSEGYAALNKGRTRAGALLARFR